MYLKFIHEWKSKEKRRGLATLRLNEVRLCSSIRVQVKFHSGVINELYMSKSSYNSIVMNC